MRSASRAGCGAANPGRRRSRSARSDAAGRSATGTVERPKRKATRASPIPSLARSRRRRKRGRSDVQPRLGTARPTVADRRAAIAGTIEAVTAESTLSSWRSNPAVAPAAEGRSSRSKSIPTRSTPVPEPRSRVEAASDVEPAPAEPLAIDTRRGRDRAGRGGPCTSAPVEHRAPPSARADAPVAPSAPAQSTHRLPQRRRAPSSRARALAVARDRSPAPFADGSVAVPSAACRCCSRCNCCSRNATRSPPTRAGGRR